MKILMEKVTELGIEDIVLITTQNTNFEADSLESYRSILVQSAEQSERLTIPRLHHPALPFRNLQDALRHGPSPTSSPPSYSALDIIHSLNKLFVCLERSAAERNHLLHALQRYSASPNKAGEDATSRMAPFGLLVGPEGGFTDAEIEDLRVMRSTAPEKMEFVSLGETVLRAETAAIAAMSIVSAVTTCEP